MSIQIKDRRKFSYTRIENSVIDNIEIFDKNDLLCYMVLCRFADNETSECFPSYKTIADKMRVSVKTAINAIKSLESKGIIHIENRKDSKGGDTSNLYTILISNFLLGATLLIYTLLTAILIISNLSTGIFSILDKNF